MLDLAIAHRLQYHPSGKFNAASLVVGAILLIIASLLAGCFLQSLYSLALSTYALLAIVVPFAVSILLSIVISKVIDLSQCRNPAIAMVVGFFCATLTCLSSYHVADVVSRCRAGGLLSEEIARVDRLPSFIIHQLHAPSGNRPRDDFSQFNPARSLLMVCELAILALYSSRAARDTASRAFDESTRQWYTPSVVRAVPGSGEQIVAALKTGQDLSAMLESIQLCSEDPRPVTPKFVNLKWQKKGQAGSAWMILESLGPHTPNEIRDAYLTVFESTDNGGKKLLFRQLKLERSELVSASRLFSGQCG